MHTLTEHQTDHHDAPYAIIGQGMTPGVWTIDIRTADGEQINYHRTYSEDAAHTIARKHGAKCLVTA